jgi:hypothetical protein
MCGFIDRAEIVPMRLISSRGLVRGTPLFVDDLNSGYLDLEDMLACDDLSFQMNIIHILVERFGVRNYDRRIGVTGPGEIGDGEFLRAHRAGINAEAEHLRSVIGDPTLRFTHEHPVTRVGDRPFFVFRSQEGYRIIHVFAGDGRSVQGGEVFVRTRDNRRLTIDQLRNERAAAAARVPAGP